MPSNDQQDQAPAIDRGTLQQEETPVHQRPSNLQDDDQTDTDQGGDTGITQNQ